MKERIEFPIEMFPLRSTIYNEVNLDIFVRMDELE